MTKFTPLMDYVLIQPTTETEMVIGGIIIPTTTTANDTPLVRGTVMAVGDGIIDSGVVVALPIAVGDEVLYRRMGSGFEVGDRLSGTKYMALPMRDIICKVRH